MHHKVSEGGAVSDVFITYDQLLDHGVPYTRVHLNRLMRKGLFPVAVQLSPNRIAWRLAESNSGRQVDLQRARPHKRQNMYRAPRPERLAELEETG